MINTRSYSPTYDLRSSCFRFTFTTDEGVEKEISVGSDANEVLTSGQSTTQFPKEHMLETNTSRFHVIDTPGIGDCRGIEKNKENFENILLFLTRYDKINAVVVLLKPNNARLTVAFKFCVLEYFDPPSQVPGV